VRGLEILAFPCNQFGGQEPGSNEDIKAFAKSRGAKFRLMDKIDVNGDGENGLFTYLKSQQGGGGVKWNFEKFLVNRKGRPVARYGSQKSPSSLTKDIEKYLL